MAKRGSPGQLAGMVLATAIRQEDSPLTKAHKMQHYLNMGHSEEEVQVTMGVSASTVANYKALPDRRDSRRGRGGRR